MAKPLVIGKSFRPVFRVIYKAGKVLALLFLAAGACNGQQASYPTASLPAHFRVTTDVVNGNVLPFAATVGGTGNSFINEGGAFEPVVFRTKYMATEAAPNRIFVTPAALSNYGSLREGFLDQASVHVYRIESGRFKMVREDRVSKDGFHVSGWNSLLRGDFVVAPRTPQFVYQWKDWNRPKAKYYFTVRALDKRGRLSPPAAEYSVARPDNVGTGEPANSLVEFKKSKWSAIANKISGDVADLPAPANLTGSVDLEGRLTLRWNPIQDDRLAGYVVYQSDYPGNAHKGFFLQLEKTVESPTEQIKAGDMVVVSKKLFSVSRNEFMSNRVWGAPGEYKKLLPGLMQFFPDEDPKKSWSLERHEPDTVVADSGESYLRLELAAGMKESVHTYNHSGTSQQWYDVLEKKTYRIEAWIRQEGSGSIRFMLGGIYDRSPRTLEPIEFKAGGEWKKYAATFTVPAVYEGIGTGNMGLEFTGPAVFRVDNFRVYRTDAGYLDFLPEDYAAVKSSHVLALRTHSWIGTKTRSYDMEQLTNGGGAISGSREKPNTLPQMLGLMRKVGVRPWLQIEFHMSPQEWLGLVEYLGAPYDPKKDSSKAKPWAYKRYAQGQIRPWVDEFEGIYLELGNETWNRIFSPWTFDAMTDAISGKNYTPGQVYGLFQEHVISSLRASPYWRQAGLDKKVKFVLGGWGGRSYGADAAGTSPSTHILSIAAYNGGWDEQEGPVNSEMAGFFDVLSQVNQTAIPVANRHAKEVTVLNAAGPRQRLGLATYEAGPGYALNGLNNARVTPEQKAVQEQVMKSMASGTATLDSFLARAYAGFDIQNFFTFGRGDFWKSHARQYDGGQAHPPWKVISLFNNEGLGDMLRVDTIGVPTAELKAVKQRQAIKDGPLVAAYATGKAGRVNLFVLSRKISAYRDMGDGFTPVTVDLPFKRAKAITLYRMTGEPKAHNLKTDDVKIERVVVSPREFKGRLTLDRNNGATEFGLPPASTFLYVFEGIAGTDVP